MNNAPEQPKPKLVFFQWDHQPNADSAKFLLLHMHHHVKCLSEYFDLTVVNQDCDYIEICDRYEPDLTLFEAGYRTHGSRRIKITNTGANPNVPKLGLHNADAWCDRRAGFLSDMEHWGIDTFFSICASMAEYTPAIADNLFTWPNFIDPEIYHDYGQRKTVPVMLTGQTYGLYPWRQKIYGLIAEQYPCLICPQFSYESRSASRMLSGESYARALNASFVAPTCGTMGKEVVRKHFEIPGSMTCLITEKTPALEAAGFIDMENCVFVDHTDVLDRLDYVFDNPEKMQRITEVGYGLVHSRHTLRHRPQIYQWLMLRNSLRPDQKIIQLGPFGDLVAVERLSEQKSAHVIGNGLDRALLQQGDACLWQRHIEGAKYHYSRCLEYVSYLPEAKFRLALCSLHEGNAEAAMVLLTQLIETTTAEYGAPDPDPVEWAYFLVSLICQGRVEQALDMYEWYPRLAHSELDCTGQALRILQRQTGTTKTLSDRSAAHRKSIHQLPDRSSTEWIRWLADVLVSCDQLELAKLLRHPELEQEASTSGSIAPGRAAWMGSVALDARTRWYRRLDAVLDSLNVPSLKPNVPPMSEFRYLQRFGRQIGRMALRGRLRGPINQLRSSLRALQAFRDMRPQRK